MPSGNKIGFGIISPETNQVGTFSIPSQYAASFPGEASPVHSLVPELGDEEQDRPSSELSVEHHASSDQGVESGDLQQSHSSKHSDKATPSFPTRLPRLSRSMSLPASSHLNQLKRPDRRDNVAALSSYQQEVSNELADTVQAVVQTLLHISPPHLLDPVKERFSTCTIQMPTPSVFSLITTMKNLNYISANLPSFGPLSEIEEVLAPSNGRASDTFDIGEVVQSVADVLGGLAAQTRVDLVLFHGDVGMKHINVVGDECCILFVLTHVVRQIINSANPGDAIELGLHLAVDSSTAAVNEDPLALAAPGAIICPSILEEGAPLSCMFDITHKFARATHEDNRIPRRPPKLDSVFLRRLMKRVNAKLTTSARTTADNSYQLSVQLIRGPSPAPDLTAVSLSLEDDGSNGALPTNLPLAKEPSLEELAMFADVSLKGKKVLFYASETSTFARRLTSYLTSWGLDIVHVPVGTDVCDERHQPPQVETGDPAPISSVTVPGNESAPSASSASTASPDVVSAKCCESGETSEASPSVEPSFIIIDDDMDVLRRRLNRYRPEVIDPFYFNKRPSLSSHHRPRSSPQVRQLLGSSAPLVSIGDASTISSKPTIGRTNSGSKHSTPSSESSAIPSNAVIVYITSLANYKLVKDTVQSAFFLVPPAFIPDIIVVPKPAGPRRFLTALHTAVNKPFIDPYFFPIATSPQTPGGVSGFGGSSYSIRDGSRLTHSRRTSVPPSSPTNARGSGQATPAQVTSLPSEWGPVSVTPLNRSPHEGTVIGHINQNGGTPANTMSSSPFVESLGYFSTGAAKFGSSAATGVMLQSPDGRPAGIYFQPHRPSTTTFPSSPTPPPERLQREHANIGLNGSRIGIGRERERERRTCTDPSSRRPSSCSTKTLGEDRAPCSTLKPLAQTPDQSNRSGEEEVTTTSTTGLPRKGTKSRPSSSHSRPNSSQGRGSSEPMPVTPVSPYSSLCSLPRTSSRRPQLNQDDDAPIGVLTRRKSFLATDSNNNNNNAPLPRRPSSPSYGSKSVERERMTRPTSSKGNENTDPDVDNRVTPDRSSLSVVSPPFIRATVKSPNLARLGTRVKRTPRWSSRQSSGMKVPNTLTSNLKAHAITPPISVLIAEDNPINQAILTTWMRRKKLKYDTATNGAEAVEKWRTGQFHLILMDIQMPVMDGIDATKEIRRLERVSAAEPSSCTPSKDGRALSESSSNPPTTPFHCSVIIVALTASSLQSDRVTALAAGCNDFLTKPVSLHWLDKKIIEWGSIKALQMWASSDQARDLRFGQEVKARSIELKLPGTGLRSTARIGMGKGEESPISSSTVALATGNGTQTDRWGASSVQVTPTMLPRESRKSSFELVRQSKPLQDVIERPEATRESDAAILGHNAFPEVIPSIATILQSSETEKPSDWEPTPSTIRPRRIHSQGSGFHIPGMTARTRESL